MATRIDRSSKPRIATALVSGWGKIPTTIAADLFRGRTLVDPAIRPLGSFGRRIAASAVTAWCEPADYGAVHHAIAAAEAGDIILVEAGGRLDVAMIGELLCGAARRKGIAGVAVNGAVRDTGTLRQWHDFAVFSRGITARGPASMERGSVNEPMTFAGVHVTPGDLVLADDDGLVIIPHAVAQEHLSAALRMSEAEQEWEEALSRGRTTLDVFKVPTAQAVKTGES